MKRITFSNCLVEALKAWMKSPRHVKVLRFHPWSVIWREKRLPHFFWYHSLDNKYYDFTCMYDDEPFIRQFWFRGYVREFPKKFVRQYQKERV
jgi:hypothetical protein